MSLFHHKQLAFQPVDPLGDGLGDDIRAEQQEAEAIRLEEQLDESLADKWSQILDDAHKDPNWFDFASEE